jgi:hypothetical protein
MNNLTMDMRGVDGVPVTARPECPRPPLGVRGGSPPPPEPPKAPEAVELGV